MTEFHKENMKKHIQFLRENADAIRKDFNMRLLNNPSHIGCGTPACSLGWASVSVGLFSRFSSEDKTGQCFGVSDYVSKDPNRYWPYLFDEKWKEINNTPEASAARMEAVLYNQVPENWDYTPEFAHPIVIIPEVLSESKTLERV